MYSPRWRKVLRDLWGNKTRSALVVLSIVVGVFGVGIGMGAGAILSRELPAVYAATEPTSAILTTTPFDDEFVQAVGHMPDVRLAEGRRTATLRIQTGPDQWRDLILTAVADYRKMQTGKIEFESGAWPPGKHELLIERAALPIANAQVGDNVVVQTQNLKSRTLRVAGLVHDQSRMPASFSNQVYGYVNLDTMEWLGEQRDYNELLFAVSSGADDREHIRRVAASVRDKVEASGGLVLSTSVPKPGEPPLNEEVTAILLLLAVFGVVCLILSGCLVINTMSALLANQVRQVGMMKAIGARRNQLTAMYLSMALAFGLAAVLIGVPAGALGAAGLALFVGGFVNADPANLSVPTGVLALQAAIGLAAPLLAALFPVLAGTRVTVRQAVNDYGLDRVAFGTGRLDLLLQRVRVLPRPVLLGLRNTFRYKGRLALTLGTLTLASAVFIGVTSVFASAQGSMEDVFRYWQYDVEVTLNRPYRTAQIEQAALRVPGVVGAESWSLIYGSRVRPDGTDSEVIWVYALPADSAALRPKVQEGRWLQPHDTNAVVISNKFLDQEPDVKVGDDIVLRLNGKKKIWHVVGIVHMMMADAPTLYVNYPYYSRVVHSAGRADGLRLFTDNADPTALMAAVKGLERTFRGSGIAISSMLSISDLRSGLEAIFAVVTAVLLVMAALLVAVGLLGLTGAISLNVLERNREIGVMRAIGAPGRAVLQVIVTEGVVIGLLSWVLGVLLSLPLSKLLSDAVGLAIMQAPFSYTFSTAGAGLWLILVVLLTASASAWPARLAVRLTVREALTYQ